MNSYQLIAIICNADIPYPLRLEAQLLLKQLT
mgnify:FL=1